MPEDEELLRVVGELRAASAAALYDFVLHRRYRSKTGGALRHLSALADAGYLRRHRIAGTKASVFHLTRKALAAFPSLAARFTDHTTKTPTEEVAAWGHLKGALLGALVQDGFVVGDDLAALTRLRRRLVDAQKALVADKKSRGESTARAEAILANLRASPALRPPTLGRCGCAAAVVAPTTTTCATCARPFRLEPIEAPHRCGRCGRIAAGAGAAAHTADFGRGPLECLGVFRPASVLPFHVASKGDDVFVVLVDNPSRAVAAQLDELPARVPGQPRLRVLLRHADDGSVYDRDERRFIVRGPRLRTLWRAFTPHENPSAFPFWETVDLVDYRPELQFRVAARRHADVQAA